jgi:hypothetical protein
MSTTPWICQVCGQPVIGETGSVGLFSVCADGARTYPNPDLPLRMTVAHHACDPSEAGYWVDCNREETPEDWMRFAVHLAEKDWFLQPEPCQVRTKKDGPVFMTLGELMEKERDQEPPRFLTFLEFWFKGHQIPLHPLP